MDVVRIFGGKFEKRRIRRAERESGEMWGGSKAEN